jgi:hypothetical protein
MFDKKLKNLQLNNNMLQLRLRGLNISNIISLIAILVTEITCSVV